MSAHSGRQDVAPLSLVCEMGCGASAPAAVAPSAPVLTESELYLRKKQAELEHYRALVQDLEKEKIEATKNASKSKCVHLACTACCPCQFCGFLFHAPATCPHPCRIEKELAKQALDADPECNILIRLHVTLDERYKKRDDLTNKITKQLINAEQSLETTEEEIKQVTRQQKRENLAGPSAEEIEEMNNKARAQAEREEKARQQQSRMLAEADARDTSQFRQVREDNRVSFEKGARDFE